MHEDFEVEMITSGVSKDHIPFGRLTFDLHPAGDNHGSASKSLSEGVGNISIYDSQITELWTQRVVSSTGSVEELYGRDKTVVLSSTLGSANASSKIIKSYTVQSKVKQVFWCSFLLPSNEVDSDTNLAPNDEVQDGFCIVESNCVTIVTESGTEHHVTLPFHINGAWPLEKGVLFQRLIEDTKGVVTFGCECAALPVWFSMLHPLADISPVICRSGSELNYVSTSSKHIVYVSSELSPYISIIYDMNSKSHSLFLIRRTTPQEEKTYTELSVNQVPDSSWQPKHSLAGASHMTPGKTAFLSLSSVLSPAATSMSPRIGALGTPSLKAHSYINSPAHTRLNPTLGANSPSLTSLHHLSVSQRSAAPSPSLSASVAHSSFTSSGNHHQTHHQDVNLPADMLEPIRPDICLHHLWSDQSSWCIKLGSSNVASDLIILGSSVNIPAKDACHALSLNMIVVLDLESNIRLYSGSVQISMLYIPHLTFRSSLESLSTTPVAPSRSTIRASSRPGSAKGSSKQHTPGLHNMVFDTSQDEVSWSPVQQELDDSAHFFLQRTDICDRVISSLHSVTKYRVVLKLLNGEMCSTELPSLFMDPVVGLCVKAFSAHLPHNIGMQALPRWYLVRNMTGQGEGGKDELEAFFQYLLDMCGFSCIADSQSEPSSPSLSKKRAKTTPQPSDADFRAMLFCQRSKFYEKKAHLFGLRIPNEESSTITISKPKLSLDDETSGIQSDTTEKKLTESTPNQILDTSAPLANHIHIVYFILHLCYEEMKLSTPIPTSLKRFAELLVKLSTCLKLSAYKMIYLKDFPELVTVDFFYWSEISLPSQIQPPAWFPQHMQSLPVMLASVLRKGTVSETVFYLPCVTRRLELLTKLYAMYHQRCLNNSDLDLDFLQPLPVVGRRSSVANQETTPDLNVSHQSTEEMMLLYMCQQGVDQFLLDSLPFAYSLVLYEVIYKCQANAKVTWPCAALKLINRLDMAALADPKLLPVTRHPVRKSAPSQDESTQLLIHQASATSKLRQLSGMEVLDEQVLKMRWGCDLRVEEVKRCLISSQPAKITLQQKPETSDHHFIELKQRHLLAICQRTMALPVGRGMMSLKSHKLVLTESLHIPVLCLSGKSYPTQSSVELSNDTQSHSASRLSIWPAFHNGVAAGLCVDDTAEVDTAWILFNKPKVAEMDELNLVSEHAGFLMALGLNGHLKNLARLSLHDYMIKGHEMTAVGILLGISASMRGTMDVSTARLLTIHTPALLPASTTHLDIAHSTKIAALVGLGLLYQFSSHRLIAGVLLHEIYHPPEVGSKNVTNDRESYSLAAGLALGMVLMGKGDNMIGLHDLNITNHLCLLINGGHKSSEMFKDGSIPSSHASNGQVYEGEMINIDVTSVGATLALGLTYFNTKSQAVYDWLKLPQTQYILETIRPDFLQIRVISLSLIMWETVLPTDQWLLGYLPDVVAKYAFKRPSQQVSSSVDYETHSQAYCYIVSGACMSIGLKFAGTWNKSAYKTLLSYTEKFLEISQKPSLVDQSGKHVLENALCTCLLSVAMVMSGSGDLQIIRICRYLRTRIGIPLATYGSHMAVHMALALLFLGSGRYTLSCKPDTLPLLLSAFFPKFPIHSNDNRYHLQALRHLYAQAAEPRLIFPIDVDTGEPCYVPLQVTLSATEDYNRFSYVTCAPTIMPQIDGIERIEICDQRHWPIVLTSQDQCIRMTLGGRSGLAVKRKYGHLTYSEDPNGVVGAMIRTMPFRHYSPLTSHSHSKLTQMQHNFLNMAKESDENPFIYLAMRDAVSRERPELLSLYYKIYEATSSIGGGSCVDFQQLFFLNIYKRVSTDCVVSKDLVDLANKKLQRKIRFWFSGPENLDHLKELLDYTLTGKQPTSSTLLNFLAFYSDISPGCLGSHSGLSVALFITKLHLSAAVAQQLMAAL